jgi:hypothetical protein
VCGFRNCTLFLFLFTCQTAYSQLKQVVNGTVLDGFSNPLVGATVQLVNSDSTFLSISTEGGRFNFLVNPGRYQLMVTFTGFSPSDEEVLVIAGKINQLTIILREAPIQLNDIEIGVPMDAGLQGGYSISIEKTMRVPANFFDPVRMATSLPGVVGTNDQSNTISIKGYSPNALLWRLQGLDIVNPNHLANAGTLSDKPVANGGGVSILSSQVLDKTNFYSGSLPIAYGNALSGAMDMSLRPGNKVKREHTVQASLIGIDLATEGPMGKITGDEGAKSSYLINYRYSTVGLLSLAGINFGDEKINFQDLTFNLDFDQEKGKHLSVFGFGGLSSNQFNRKDSIDWETEKDRYNIDFNGKVFGIGMSSIVHSNSKSNWKMGLAVSGQQQDRQSESADVNSINNYIDREGYRNERTLISGTINYNQRLATQIWANAGLIATSFQQQLEVATLSKTNGINQYPNLTGSVDGVLWQPYVNASWKTKIAEITGGVRYVYFNYNGSSAIEPRVTVSSQVFNGQLLLGYGITSQMQQTQTYLSFQNSKLDLTKAHQFTASYHKSFDRNLSFKINTFYHKLFDVPVSADANPFSTLNQMDEFVTDPLTSTGLGRNYGADILLEKKFINQIYFIAGGSWYNSVYSNGSSTYRSTRYNGRFTSSISSGREWSRKKNKAFGFHTRLLYLGGLRQQQINEFDSFDYGETRYEDRNVYPTELPDYFRLDVRVSWRKNKPNYTRTLSLDIQNLTGQQNTAYYYYDTHLQRLETKYQLGIIPVLVYRVDF